jgi:CheY-like chemotaxis protein
VSKTKGVVLVVDDEAAVRHFAVKVLKRRGFTVLEAVSGPAAIEMAGAARGKVRLLLTDIVLPGLNGDEVARQLQGENPDLKVMFMSGYEEKELQDMGVAGVGAAYITKPFTADVLTLMVEGALQG